MKMQDQTTKEPVSAHNLEDVFVILHSLTYGIGKQALLKVELLHPHFINDANHLADLVEIGKQQRAMESKREFSGVALSQFYKTLMLQF